MNDPRELRRKLDARSEAYQRYWAKNRVRKCVQLQQQRAATFGAEGTFTLEEWLAVCAQHDQRCAICGAEKQLYMDHIRPLSKGGSNWITNIQPLCKPCNSRKRDRWNGDVL